MSLAAAAPMWVRFGSVAGHVPTAPVDHLLLVVYMGGGNDGLNTVVPYLDSAYKKNRPAVGLKESDVNPLGDGLGLHKSLARMYKLWQGGNLGIVQNVGYPK